MCVIAQMLLFTGCEDKEQVSSYLALDKDEQSQSFTAAASTKEITLFSNLGVIADISPVEATAWCRFSLKSVTEAESVLIISVDENTVKKGRKAIITLTAPDYRNVKVNITQSGIILPIKLTEFEPHNGGKMFTKFYRRLATEQKLLRRSEEVIQIGKKTIKFKGIGIPIR